MEGREGQGPLRRGCVGSQQSCIRICCRAPESHNSVTEEFACGRKDRRTPSRGCCQRRHVVVGSGGKSGFVYGVAGCQGPCQVLYAFSSLNPNTAISGMGVVSNSEKRKLRHRVLAFHDGALPSPAELVGVEG